MDNLNLNTVKVLELHQSQSHPNPKIPRKKVVSKTSEWAIIADKYSTQESQQNVLLSMVHPETGSTEYEKLENLDDLDGLEVARYLLLTHLRTKQSGYKSQDKIKKIYDPSRFIQIQDIIHLLFASNLSCFYCKKWTTLFYENVREPRQWSLERLSNKEGHNKDNVVIACLECNMRRRTMYHERYIATKQLKVNKLGTTTTDEEDEYKEEDDE